MTLCKPLKIKHIMISKNTITFLKDLKQNNNRDWFLSKNKEYQNAKLEFTGLIEKIIKIISKKAPEFASIDAAKCLFRINRDVRFSANKAPYKTNFGASINLYGKKSLKAGYYLHLEPGSSFVGGGVYMPPADVLAKVRQEIDYNFDDFQKILSKKNFTQHYGTLDMSDALKNPPRGYEINNKALEYLKLKSIVAFSNFKDKDLSDDHFAEIVAEKLLALKPLIDFINKGLDD